MNIVPTCECTGSTWTPASNTNLVVAAGATETATINESTHVVGTKNPPGCDCRADFYVTMSDPNLPFPSWITFDKSTSTLTASPGAGEAGQTIDLVVRHFVGYGTETYDEPLQIDVITCSLLTDLDTTSSASLETIAYAIPEQVLA